MRSRFIFPGDEILRKANKIELTIHRDEGEMIGVEFKVSGELTSCNGGTTEAVLRALLNLQDGPSN